MSVGRGRAGPARRFTEGSLTDPRDPVAFPGGSPAVWERLKGAFATHANRTAFVTDRRISTFRDLEDRAVRLAGVLRALCGEGGRTVAFVLTPRPEELCDIRLAAFRNGATLVVVSPSLPPEAMGRMLASAAPDVVFYDPSFLPDLPRVLSAAVPESRAVSVSRGRGSLADLLRDGSSVDAGPPPSEDRPAAIGFSSGTTGPPKGVTVSHGAYEESARRIGEIFERIGVRPGDALFGAIPLFAAGGGMLLPLLSAGMTLHVPDRWDAARAIAKIERHRIAWAFLSPSQLIDLLDQPLERCDLGSLRGIVYGTAAMPASRLREAVQRLPVRFVQGYGMSECFPPVTILWPDDHGTASAPADSEALASAGRPYPGVGVRIDDRGRGSDGTGEILVSSSTLTSGYWNDADRTAAAIHEGWFRSGDVGRFDAEGRLHVLHRKEDVLKRGDREIGPRRIEELASDHAIVKEACAVSGDDERILLAVSLRPAYRKDPETSRQSLKEWLESRLPRDEVPDDVRIFDELPRSAAGKVLKRAVREALFSRPSRPA